MQLGYWDVPNILDLLCWVHLGFVGWKKWIKSLFPGLSRKHFAVNQSRLDETACFLIPNNSKHFHTFLTKKFLRKSNFSKEGRPIDCILWTLCLKQLLGGSNARWIVKHCFCTVVAQRRNSFAFRKHCKLAYFQRNITFSLC